MDRAWAALMVGDMDQVLVETQYVDGPNRLLGKIAGLIRDGYGNAAGEWLEVSNLGTGGLSPRRFLDLHDMSTWYIVRRLLIRRVDLGDLDHHVKSGPTGDPP